MGDVWSLYSEKVMEHFRNPRNVGEIEKVLDVLPRIVAKLRAMSPLLRSRG